MILCYLIKFDVVETNGYSLQAIPYALLFIYLFYYYFFFIVGYIYFPKLRLTKNN